MLVRSCFLITVINCLKGHWSLGLLFNVKKQKVAQSLTQWQGHLLSCQVTAKKHKNYLGSPSLWKWVQSLKVEFFFQGLYMENMKEQFFSCHLTAQ